MPPSTAPTSVRVLTGAYVDTYRPTADTLHLDDIARSLAHRCRFGGHIKRFYCVAEHSLLVRDLIRAMGGDLVMQRAALFHDAAEAYLADVPSPLKMAMRRETYDMDPRGTGRFPTRESAYDRLTTRMDAALVERFDISAVALESPALHTADTWALRIEARELVADGGDDWAWPSDLPNDGQLPGDVVWWAGLDARTANAYWTRAAVATGVSDAA